MTNEVQRCGWSSRNDLMIRYHDTEWGVPLHDSLKLFEFFVLDAFQAGLNWEIILKKRENFREAFDGFDPERIVAWDDAKRAALLENSGIIRNRAKIDATRRNADAFLRLRDRGLDFSGYLWQFTGGKPKVNHWKTLKDIPVSTPESDAMSKALKKDGFSFVGTTICYAFMQAAGMVNDHLVSCFRYNEILENY